MKEKDKLFFLCYLNRSGSTYLAKLLNEYKEIGVTIESSFPDGILRKELIINKEKEISKKIKKLYNIKFNYWGISKYEIKEVILNKNKYPIYFREFFIDILSLYFNKNKPDAKIFVYKTSWDYLINYEKVLNYYPNSKFIFIIRDGRAIYNSQKKSLGSNTLKPMSDNPVRTALMFNKIAKKIRDLKDKKWLYIIKYENLILNKEEEIEKLLEFLEVKDKTKTNSDYYRNIPLSQKHLHYNLNKPPQKDRINGWKNELKKEEIYMFQKVSGKYLSGLGYNLEDIHYNFFKQKLIEFKFLFQYLLYRTKDKFIALTKPNYLFNRIWYKIKKNINNES